MGIEAREVHFTVIKKVSPSGKYDNYAPKKRVLKYMKLKTRELKE